MSQVYILIDGSYFCFYRYYSLLSWWKRAHPEEPLEEPFQNTIFVEKFKKLFDENIETLLKTIIQDKEERKNAIIMVGKDCSRKDIWRRKLFSEYKANRNYDNFKGGPFFEMVYKDELFIKNGVKKILYHEHLEADDCIALTTKHLLKKDETGKIFIIASDKDYLQLVDPRVQIFDLAFKNISLNKSSTGDAQCDLFCKSILGDVSDNIPPLLKKCGPKTTLKYYQEPSLFLEKIKIEGKEEQWELNKTLVDFSRIPNVLVEEFFNQNNLITPII
jgi:5'-3' exonuclease